MPPSPALRFSPSRELRGENHKRGRSLGSGVILKEKDDDLALFKEMESREREDFLLLSSDDFEDTFSSKLKHFSVKKLSITIPVMGESSELLNTDGDKNDYDWLLTPPDTPLFPSLDDEPPPVAAPRRSRPLSQPISISRSSTMEKSNRSSRGSASPNRLSPSPRSGSSTFQSRGRPSSAPHSSPKPSLRAATPTRRPSPAPRSSTPTSGVRGTSPVRTSRGNSASPKVRAWQSNIPGFLIDTPPNLRTSLTDRPASYVRGSSPASRNSRDSVSRCRRQSTSVTTARSVSSSHSHDQFSSHSKGSIASSMDDDSDSLQSGTLGSSECSFSKRVGSLPSNRSLAFSKKPSRIISPGSASKRSFDSAVRQMDHRKNPQNMFRPLFSSAPSTTYYMGKGSSHHPIFATNPSMTTSSNRSSDLFTSFAPDTGEGDHRQYDLAEREKVQHPDVRQEVFGYDKIDKLSEDTGLENRDSSLDTRHGDFETANDRGPSCSEDSTHHVIGTKVISTSNVSRVGGDCSEHGSGNMEICSKCRHQYCVVEPVEADNNLCPDCREQPDLVTTTISDTATVVDQTPLEPGKFSEEYKSIDEIDLPIPVPQLLPQDTNELEPVVSQDDEIEVQGSQSHLQENSDAALVEKGNDMLNSQNEIDQRTVGDGLQEMDLEVQQLQHSNESPVVHVDSSDGAGISVLLKRTSCSKGPVIQGRTFIASAKPFENLSYTRESANSFRSSTGCGSASASSSVDYGSARQTETRAQQQLSGKKYDMENYRCDVTSESPNSISSFSGVSNHDHLGLGLAAFTLEEYSEVPVAERGEGDPLSSRIPLLEDKEVDVTNSSFTGMAAFEGKGSSIDRSTSELSSSAVSIQLEDNSESSVQNSANGVSYENKDAQVMVSEIEMSHITPGSPLEEHSLLNNNLDRFDVADVPGHCPLTTISEIEIENTSQKTPYAQTHDESPKSKCNSNGLQEHPSPESVDKDVAASVPEPNFLDHPSEILDESTVMMEFHGGSKARSVTLEEATDTILFCSSIVHDLAYKAASIAIEKDNEEPVIEVLRPTFTVLGKSNTDRRGPHGRTVPKRTSKLVKARQRHEEKDQKFAPGKTENDENAGEPMMCNVGIPDKADGMKPPKLESKCNCTIM